MGLRTGILALIVTGAFVAMLAGCGSSPPTKPAGSPFPTPNGSATAGVPSSTPSGSTEAQDGNDRPHEFYVSLDGTQIVRRSRHRLDDDVRKALKAQVTLSHALETAARRVPWSLSEAEIDTHRGRITWERWPGSPGQLNRVLRWFTASHAAACCVRSVDQ